MLIQILLVFGFITAFWLTWRRMKQEAITMIEALAWSALWTGGAIVVLQPKITDYFANLFGVGRGVDLMLYAAVAIQFFLIFKLFLMYEKSQRQLTEVVRKMALGSEKEESRKMKEEITNENK